MTVQERGKKKNETSFKYKKIIEMNKGKKSIKTKIPLNIGISNIIYLNTDNNDMVELVKCFRKIIENQTLWKEEKVFKIEISEQEKVESQENKNFNFLSLLQKEYDENIYTNLLEYYFNVKYKKMKRMKWILYLMNS